MYMLVTKNRVTVEYFLSNEHNAGGINTRTVDDTNMRL